MPVPQRPPARLRSAASIALPLLVGGAIYLGFRGEELLMFRAAGALGIGGAVDAYRAAVASGRPYLPAWAVYSLPHALWSFSMLVFFAALWRDDAAQLRLWLGITVAVTAGSELLQGISLVPGTFSGGDTAGIALAYLAFWLVSGRHLPPVRFPLPEHGAGTWPGSRTSPSRRSTPS